MVVVVGIIRRGARNHVKKKNHVAPPHAHAYLHTVDASTRTVRLSMILKWYGGDFLPPYLSPSASKETAVLRHVLPWLPPESRERVQGWLEEEGGGGGVKVEFLPYDWGINARE